MKKGAPRTPQGFNSDEIGKLFRPPNGKISLWNALESGEKASPDPENGRPQMLALAVQTSPEGLTARAEIVSAP